MRPEPAGGLSGSLFLVGFMGSGKSACGRALADILNVAFVDTDQRVVEEAGRSIDELFGTEGEGRFREREERALRALGEGPPAVVATGGGLFAGHAQRRFMIERGWTAWLDAPFAVVEARIEAARASAEPVRPLWNRTDRIARRVLFEKRRAVYALAHVRVESFPGSPEQIANRVVARLSPRIFR